MAPQAAAENYHCYRTVEAQSAIWQLGLQQSLLFLKPHLLLSQGWRDFFTLTTLSSLQDYSMEPSSYVVR